MELFSGEVVGDPAPMVLHDLPGRIIVRSTPEHYEAWAGHAIDLGPEDRPRPDAMIIRAGDWADDMRGFPASAVLAVVEVVAPGRAAIRRDYQDKHLKYEQAGIPVYLIVDPNIGKWQLFQISDEGRYRLVDSGVFGDPITFPAPMDFEIPTATFHQYPEAQEA